MHQTPGSGTTQRRTPAGRHLRRAVAAAGGLMLVAGLASVTPGTAEAAGPSKAPTISSTEVTMAATTLTSSKHHKLRISAYVTKSPGSKVGLSVTVGLPNGHESHGWNFTLPGSALKLNAKGSGKVKAASKKTDGFAALTLKVKAKGARHVAKCQGEAVSASRKAKISGKLVFDTKSRWGKLGSKHHTLHFAKSSSVYWSYQSTGTCSLPPSPCQSYVSWNLSQYSATHSVNIFGSVSGKRVYVSGSRLTHLAKPQGATRSDWVTLGKSKAPKLTVHNDQTATLKAFAGKGSATLTSTGPASTYTSPCGTGSKQEKSDGWSTASIAQHDPPLKLHAQVYGALKVPASASASFYRTKVVG